MGLLSRSCGVPGITGSGKNLESKWHVSLVAPPLRLPEYLRFAAIARFNRSRMFVARQGGDHNVSHSSPPARSRAFRANPGDAAGVVRPAPAAAFEDAPIR
jgi:hypothetical protein